METPSIGLKVVDRAGEQVTVLLRPVGAGYYAMVSEAGKVPAGSSKNGVLGRGATIDEAIKDLLDARERMRLRS